MNRKIALLVGTSILALNALSSTSYKTEIKENVEYAVTQSVIIDEAYEENDESEEISVETVSADFDSIEAISEASLAKAKCETSLEACVVDIENEHNPYDVVWDYGDVWNAYVDECDWTLVFDAEYYKKSYPMLAILYNQDDELLLEHFATVGVHEGRQGCESFNVEAYLDNCSYKVYDAFRSHVEGAYIYYMLHYETENEINTKTLANGEAAKKQMFTLLTKAQSKELEGINYYRKQAGASNVRVSSEFCAFANYRAYVNRENGSAFGEGHDWAKAHTDIMIKCLNYVDKNAQWVDENTYTGRSPVNVDLSTKYYNSESHKEAMCKNEATITGISNYYYTSSDGLYSEFDMYTY